MNLEREVNGFVGFTVCLVVLVLLAFSILHWLHVPTGNFLDWIVGTVSFWWLMVIVTVPWNIHFAAKTVLVEAATSREKGIQIDDRACKYAAKVEKRALWVALGLHFVSAIVLYLLAATGISAIGYLSSIAALLLTALRPAISAYQYLVQRLSNIGKEFKYPREDIVELRTRLQQLTLDQENLAWQLNLEESGSWAAKQQRSMESLQQDLAKLSAAHEQLKATNDRDHDRISQETRSAIAQLNEDSQFLDRVREIVRFFKEA